MRKQHLRTILAATGVATASMMTLGAGGAHAVDGGDRIIGGSTATDARIVQLIFTQDGSSYGCTGEAISDEWILTAQHCTDGDTSMNVYYSNDTTDRGTPVKADQWYGSPDGDVGLVHLSTPHPLSSYLKISDSAAPTSGEGTIYGYGARANSASSDHLYKASVEINDSTTDAYYGNAIHVNGINGAANHGDSGGPLIVDGEIVGVCSTGDESDPGANTEAGSNYADLSSNRSWIEETSGI